MSSKFRWICVGYGVGRTAASAMRKASAVMTRKRVSKQACQMRASASRRPDWVCLVITRGHLSCSDRGIIVELSETVPVETGSTLTMTLSE